MTNPRFAVVLAGCGVQDGSEIHEAVSLLLAIDRQGGTYRCFAPDIAQHDVIDHRTGKPSGAARNVLTESARIARGKIEPLSAFKADEFEALAFPGGFGAAKNLCSFASDGAACTVQPDVARAILAMHAAAKPIGALCIAPVIVAAVLKGCRLTIGNDGGTAAALESMGAHHVEATAAGAVVDAAHKVVTAPCYMTGTRLSEIADGAAAVVAAMIGLM